MAEAARARSQADWLVGINGTRRYTLEGRKKGHNRTLSVGRVQTPTLKLIVDRDRAIENFVPITHYRVAALVKHPTAGNIVLEWKPRDGAVGSDDAGRVIDPRVAERIVRECKDAKGVVVAFDTDTSTENPPLPLDMTALTQVATAKLDITASQLMKIAQRLYDLGFISYPRSDCRYLPENQHPSSPAVLAFISQVAPHLAGFARGAKPDMMSAAWNGQKITAHHAIVPVSNPEGKTDLLSAEERGVYDIIARSYISQFYPPATYATRKITATIGHETFQASSREMTMDGWRAIFANPDKAGKQSKILPVVDVGDKIVCERAESKQVHTTPPDHYTDGTLIARMANIHEIERDPKLRKILEDAEGIGTTATRNRILDTLLEHGLVARKDRRYLVATDSGFIMVDKAPEELSSPSLTALAEAQLAKIEKGTLTRGAFVLSYTKRVHDYDTYAKEHPPAPRMGHHKPKRYKPVLGTAPTEPSLLDRSRRRKPSLRDPETAT
jgi:DNA topoisomerase-3